MSVARQPKGIPVGGQYAANAHDEADAPLVTENPRKSIGQFVYALRALDAELHDIGVSEPVKVRATGGFALLSHGLREDGYTVDIDTITADYEPRVRDAINRVAHDLHTGRVHHVQQAHLHPPLLRGSSAHGADRREVHRRPRRRPC